MKKKQYQKLRFILSAILLLAPLLFFAQEKGEMIIKVDNPGMPGSFTFENHRGSVVVEGYEGEWLIVSASVRKTSTGGVFVPEGMELIPQHQFELKAETGDNIIQLFCESGRTVDFNIKVPRRFSLDISSLDNGDIEIIRIDGEIEVDNRGGEVKLININGSTVVSTVYGDINADIRHLEEGETVMLTSYEGEISLGIDREMNADFILQSQTGNIFSDVRIETQEPQIIIRENGKGKEYHLEAWSKGRLNDGGVNIYLSSYVGNIYLKERTESNQ